MDLDEALDWIQQVDGVLYQHPNRVDQNDAWVAVVRSPGTIRGPARVIVTSGRTLPLAATAAEKEWNELWEGLGHGDSLDSRPWPEPDRDALTVDRVELVVQINGRVRAKIDVEAGTSEDEIIASVLANERVRATVGERPIKRTIVVPGRVVNLVV